MASLSALSDALAAAQFRTLTFVKTLRGLSADPRTIRRKRWLRAWAVAHGVKIPADYHANTPSVGPAARELIANVQRRAFKGEHTTAKFDQRTLDLIRPKETPGVKALRVALREVGVTEHPHGSNDGPRVREYQRVTGAYELPWCASFVTWAYFQSGIILQGFNTALVQSWVLTARAKRERLRVVAAKEALPGDAVCYGPNAKGVAYHIGLLNSRVQADGSFTAVEGNTSSDDWRVDANGGGVFVKHRNTNQVMCFVRVGD